MATLLETNDLVTNFYTFEGVVKALNRVSMVIDLGVTFGLVGESGCGKSVTVRSIMRIVPAPGRIEGGKVVLYMDEDNKKIGVDLLKQSEAFMEGLRGDSISMIFQEPNAALNPIMSIGDQVSESFLFHQKKEMCEAVLAELCSSSCRTFYPLKKLLHSIYGAAVRNSDGVLMKILDLLPFMKI